MTKSYSDAILIRPEITDINNILSSMKGVLKHLSKGETALRW